jgi:signal transduction histidine kinase
MTSLRSRLSAGLLMSLVAMLALLWLITAASGRTLMESQLASRLAHDGESLLGGLTLRADGGLELDAQRIQGIYQQPFSGHYFVVEAGGAALRSRSLWDETLPPMAELGVGENRLDYVTGPGQQPLLLWSSAFVKQGRVVRIGVAEDLAALQDATHQLQRRLLGWSLAVVLSLLIVQRYIVVRSLRPVARAAGDVARLEHGEILELGERVPDEVLPLVHAINQLLLRQQQRLQRSREALGNLAHAINTPLTLLQQLGREKLSGDRQAAQQLEAYGRQITTLIEQSLRRARLAGDSLGARRFDLHEDLGKLVDTLERLHRDKSVRFEQQLHGASRLPLEQQDAMELLGNLLDNAWKWAAGEVCLSVAVDAGVEILVEDDGPGVDADAMEALGRRGVRQDEATPGHGLGLSIVSSLVQQLDGSMELSRSPRLGGLRVRVRLGGQTG